MTAGVTVRLGTATDLPAVAEVYRDWGYRARATEADTLIVAEARGRVVGVVRITNEYGYTMLRGMRVRPEFQRGGVGTRMLHLLVGQLDSDCYCVPYAHLLGFYGQVGFREISEQDAPQFLVERARSYRAEGLEVAIAHRPL